MGPAKPSRTALRVALRRAAHQLYDWPLVFKDAFAVRVLGAHADELSRTPATGDGERHRRPYSRSMRAYVAVRSRFAEDALDAALAGAEPPEQYLLLGAGLDTFALRNSHNGLRVFEVDHPATQVWKQELLRSAGLVLPLSATLVAADLEIGVSLRDALLGAGFKLDSVTAVAWLGVVPYLSSEAFVGTLACLAGLPRGSILTLDYMLPASTLGEREQQMYSSLAARVAAAGEPFQLAMVPEQIAAELRGFGFDVREDLAGRDLNERYLAARADALEILEGAGRMLCAVRA